jgi:hypothetical protein
MALALLKNECASRPFCTGLLVMIDSFEPPFGVEERFMPPGEGEVVELPLLLPEWQMSRLERVAHQHGMTAAAMVRHLLRDFLTVALTQQRASSS